MRRALNRAYQRLRGNHPRRPKSAFSGLISLAMDAILVIAAAAALGGAALIVLALLDGFSILQALCGVALGVLAVALLYVWERLAWEPVARKLSQLT